jgi:hypothetical protein
MKIVYNIIKSLKPYFFSLREIQENVSLDIKLPTKWIYEGMKKSNEEIPFAIKVQDKKTEHTLVSLISPATVEGYEMVFKYAKTVISTNVEEEEKLKLFNQKMGELKELFLNSPLEKLKDISFKETQDELSNTPGDEKIKLGDEKGPGADGKS